MRLIAPQFSKNRCNIDRDALAIGPRCVPIQINIFGCFLGRHAYLVTFFGLLINELEITFYLTYPFFIGNGAVSRNDGIHLPLRYAITSPPPVAGWPGPETGMP